MTYQQPGTGGSFNWGDLLKIADKAGFNPVPPGDYHVVVDKAEATQTKGGKDMIKVTFQVVEGPHAESPIINRFTISPENANAIGFFFRHMNAMGITADFFKNSVPLSQVAQALVGRHCMIKTSQRDWEGRTQVDVDDVKPYAGLANGGPAPAPVIPGGVVPPAPVPAPAPAPAPTPAPPAPAPAPAPVPEPTPEPTPEPVADPPKTQTAPPDLPF